METNSTVSLKSVRYQCPFIKPSHSLEEAVSDRQERLKDFNQKKLTQSTLLLIGGGGIGGEIGWGSVRKGIGLLKICDHDQVSMSNLNRQHFYSEDLYKNKAAALAKNLVREGTMGTKIIGYPFPFQELVEKGEDLSCDVMIVGVDNDDTRTSAAQYGLKTGIPVIFTAVDRIADHGYVFIQESRKDTPCFGCLFPDAVRNPGHEACPSAAVIDILKVVAGLVLYTIDTLIMERKRNWIYRDIFLAGFSEDGKREIIRRPNCPICGNEKELRKEEKPDK